MVHIKRVELTNFKSFGGTTSIPVLPGFTVVSGPNGSGKSNILDALLFCLGLSSSKGMRAERLPDLVNSAQNKRGTIEASVTATFALKDVGEEWFARVEDEKEKAADEVEGIEIAETQDNNGQSPAENPASPLSVEEAQGIETAETLDNNGKPSPVNRKSQIPNRKSDELSVEEVEEIEIAATQDNKGQLLATNRKSKSENRKSDELSVEEVEEIEIAATQDNNGQLLATNRKAKSENRKSDELSVEEVEEIEIAATQDNNGQLLATNRKAKSE